MIIFPEYQVRASPSRAGSSAGPPAKLPARIQKRLIRPQGTGLFHEAGLLYLDHLFEESEVSKVTWSSFADNYRSRCAALALGFPDSTKQGFHPDLFDQQVTNAYLALTGNEFPGIWAFDLSREEWNSSAKPSLERRISARRALRAGTVPPHPRR